MSVIDLTQISIDELDQISDLQGLKAWTTECTACGLRQEASQVVHSSGDLSSPIMFVGMNPGFCEDATGYPFCGRDELVKSRCVSCSHYTECFDWQTGLGASRPRVQLCKGYAPLPAGTAPYEPSKEVHAGPFKIGGIRSAGQLLDDVLHALGIDREKIFITNSALCKTTAGEPKAQYVNSCSRIRLRTQALLAPKVIVALGRLAIGQYTGKMVTLSRTHGIPFAYKQGGLDAIVVPTYHPAAILRKMLAASSMTLEERTRAADDITREKWALYNDLATAFNTLSETNLQGLLKPTVALSKGKLVTKTR
jgi:uracil-DNA glycosylase family 4